MNRIPRTPPPTRGIGKFQTAGKGRVFARHLWAIEVIVAPAATPPQGAPPPPAGRLSGKRLGIRASPCSGIVPSHPHRRSVRFRPTLPFGIFFLTPGRAIMLLTVCLYTPPPTPLIFEGVVFGVCLLFCLLHIFVFELNGAGCLNCVGY